MRHLFIYRGKIHPLQMPLSKESIQYMMVKILYSIALLFLSLTLNAQRTTKNNFYFKSGIGGVYSFFKTESAPFPTPTLIEINSKNPLGRVIDFELGKNLKRNYSVSFRFSDHKYEKSYNIQDTIGNTTTAYSLIGKLYRHQYYYQLLLNKEVINSNRELFGIGIGFFLINESDQFYSATAGWPGVGYPSVNLHEYPHLEGGVPFALYYEHKLNSLVSFGIKTQAYIIVSVGSFESISLNPYFKANF